MTDIDLAARRIADCLHTGMRVRQLVRVDFDGVKCAVAGYLAGTQQHISAHQIKGLEDLTLRRFVEKAS